MSNVDNARAAVAEAIAVLRKDYLLRLPAEVTELQGLAAGLRGGEADRTALNELHHRLHKLAGSGGTFGLSALSERARVLEQTVKQRLDGALAGLDRAALNSFVEGLSALRESFANEVAAVTEAPQWPTGGRGGDTERLIHIWLVEDDALLGQELTRLLGQFGYAVRLFTRVGDAEIAAAAEQPDALVMDVTCPEEGINAIEAVAMRPAFQVLACPILFVSADGDFRSRAIAARLGAAGFLLKPLDVPRLVDRLEQVLGQRLAMPYRVLIVDDDVSLSEHFGLVLRAAGMEIEVLNRPEEIIERVAGFRPELILLDINMPGYSGLELATVIRQHDEWLALPIVYLSAETDFDKQLKALARGADDFITKPISDAHLVAAVSVRAARSRQLADLMSKDSLTGLLKHSRIKEEVEIEVLRARRNGKPVSVAMVDIDHFKLVNDTYGHAVGDRVIKAIAHLLRQRLRKSDLVGRYGGEEFVAVLPECDETTAQQVIDNIRSGFSALRFRHDGQEFACSFSAGIASSARYPNQGGSVLLVAADTALYAAKHGGRNQVRVASSSPAAPSNGVA